MSDQASQQAAQVGGWWMASDGKWYPPELHPSVTAATAATPPPEATAGEPTTAVDQAPGSEPAEAGPPTAVPELADSPPGTPDRPADVPEAVPHLSRWTETARVAAATTARTKGGTQLPDMLQQAMGDDGGDVLAAGGDGSGDGGSYAPAGVTTAGSGTPGVGEFTGASARRRRIRWH